MKKVWWLLLLIAIPAVDAALISDWPMFFVKDKKFSAQYVIGEEAPSLDVVSATVISTSLAKFENVTVEVGTSKLDSEISDIAAINAIVVGSPCENRAAYKLMGEPEPCYKDLGGSLGYIKLYENNGKIQLLITGFDEKDRHAAAKYLAERNLNNIKTQEYIVASGSGSVPAFFEQKLKALNKTPENVTSDVAEVGVTEPVPAELAPKPTPGPYEPLKEIPKKEKLGFWGSIWAWIRGLFA
jgi:hypothetical protein